MQACIVGNAHHSKSGATSARVASTSADTLHACLSVCLLYTGSACRQQMFIRMPWVDAGVFHTAGMCSHIRYNNSLACLVTVQHLTRQNDTPPNSGAQRDHLGQHHVALAQALKALVPLQTNLYGWWLPLLCIKGRIAPL